MNWISKTEFIDVESGEIINQARKRVEQDYKIFKTEKNINYEQRTTYWTNYCRRKAIQQEIRW